MSARRKGLSIILFIAFLVCLTACSSQREIEKLIFVRTVAIDQAGDGNVRLTIQSETQTVKGSEETKKIPLVLSSEGKTLFDATRNFASFAEKSIFWGHTEYILLSEEAAREDVLKYIDFFIRDHEGRLNAKIAIVRNASGSEVFETNGDTPTDELLSNLYSNIKGLSESKEILISDFIETLSSKYSSAYLPCIQILEKGGRKSGGSDKKFMSLDGYAVLKGKSLSGFITGKEARGLNWIKGDIKSGIIVVNDPKGNKISLEIIDSYVNIHTEMQEDIPIVTVNVKTSSNIGEIQGQLDVLDKKSISQLEKQQADTIRAEIESAINFSKQNNVDILGFGDKVYHQHPMKWERIKDNWDKMFPRINVKIEIETKINRSYNIGKPIRNWEEKSK